MCPSAPKVCSKPDGQKPVLSLSLDRIETVSPEGAFCDTVQVPSSVGDMELN